MRRLLVGIDVNSQQVYGSVGKIQRSEQVAVPPSFHLYQYSLGGDLVEVFVLVVMENATFVELSKAY